MTEQIWSHHIEQGHSFSKAKGMSVVSLWMQLLLISTVS
jgi:hypothetical protein